MNLCLRRPGSYWLAILFIFGLLSACDTQTSIDPKAKFVVSQEAPRFVGSEECSACHDEQFKSWKGSHHDLAMQHANPQTVVGDFDDVTVNHGGVESFFFTRDGSFRVRTDNADGESEEFEIRYTFGVTPLQQYLIEFSDGRLQTLPLAWDARDEAAGGQRWFHVYGEEIIAHDDLLHWTGREQNWNYMCAECHSTDLQKNYDVEAQSFATIWSEINVGCEGCHGPGSQHIALANAGTLTGTKGLLVDLDDAGRAVWEMNPGTGIAERSELRMRPPQQPEACGRCHSRRAVITQEYQYGQLLLDTHMPSLLDENLYFADGQIEEEVYVWGSFVQSKMYQAGVSCSDCHDPHTATLKASGEVSTICSTCHLPAKFASTDHHKHEPEQVSCVDCHMPSRDYMVIDGRRDHSFRIPRPDLTMSTGSPNACENCHEEEGAEWASATLNDWNGGVRPIHFAEAIAAGRGRSAGANALLAAAANNASFPGIARATAVSLLGPPLDSAAVAAIRSGLTNADPLLRLGSLRALRNTPGEVLAQLVSPLLTDSVRAVRIETASLLSSARSELPQGSLAAYDAAENEYIAAQMAIAERPEAHSNLASIYAARGDVRRAELSYRQALRMEPRTVGARVNLADLYRRLDRDEEAKELLQAGLELDAGTAALAHTLGLLLIRVNQSEDALVELERAAILEPQNSRYQYVYAIGLNTFGRTDEAIDVLQASRQESAGDFDIGWALITILRDAGRIDDARLEAMRLQMQYPENQDVRALLASFTSQ